MTATSTPTISAAVAPALYRIIGVCSVGRNAPPTATNAASRTGPGLGVELPVAFTLRRRRVPPAGCR